MTEPAAADRRCARCNARLSRWSSASVCWPCMMESQTGSEAREGAVALPAAEVPGGVQLAGPSRFGDYLLEREIAHGGMGVVYQARQLSLGRVVAVKVLLLGRYSSAESIERFKREAQSAAALHHPNIVAIYEVGQHEGQHYFSMEYVDGRSLAEILREGPLQPGRAAEITRAVAGAIHYAHEQGVLHRDLKPSNVLIDHLQLVRVTDFGLAKKLDGSSDLTMTGQMVGTPNYLSPEQAAGRQEEVGPASDVYAIGALLYELLTGRPPFLAQSLQETLLRISDAEPVSPRALNPALPRDLETICLKCLQKEPARRYATAQALAEDLGRWLQQLPIEARPTGHLEKSWLWCRRKPRQAALLVAFVLAVAGGFAGVLYQWSAAEAARKRADELRVAADTLRREAELQEAAARRRAYASDIGLAQRALEENNIGRARELLERQRPGLRETDLRGWEWRYLWQQCQSDALFTLGQENGAITGLSPSADGRCVAVVSEAGSRLSLWDVAERHELTTVFTGAPRIMTAFSPVEPLLAYTSVGDQASRSTNTLHLWDPVRRQELRAWRLPGQCRSLAFSADGRRLLTVSREGGQSLDVWNVSDGRLIAGHSIPRFADSLGLPFAAGADLDCVAMGMSDYTIAVINAGSGQWITRIGTNVSLATALALNPDHSVLAAGFHGADPHIQLYELPGGRELHRINGPFGYPASMMFADNGKTLLAACSDQTIRRWDMNGFQPAGILRGHKYEVWRFAYLPGGGRMVSGSGDGELLVWDAAAKPDHQARLKAASDGWFFWRFAPDGHDIILAREDGRVIRRGGPDYQQAQTLGDMGPDPYDAGASDDCRWVAASDRKGKIRVWSLGQWTLRRELTTGFQMAAIWGFADNGNRLLVVRREDQTLHEWDLVTGVRRDAPRNLAGWRVHESFRQGRVCHALGLEIARRWGSSSASRYSTNELLRVFTGAFSADEQLFASAAEAGKIHVEQAVTGEQVALARAVLQGLHSVAFSRQHRLATGGDNREAVKLWQLDSFQELLTLPAEGAIFSQTRFSPDGCRVGSMDNRGNLYIWSAPTWDEIAVAEGSLH